MKSIYIISDNIVTPLGATTEENFTKLSHGITSIKLHNAPNKSLQPFYGSLFPEDFWLSINEGFTKFEHLLATSIQEILIQSKIDPTDNKTGLIISSTKGNVSLLEEKAVSPQLKQDISLSQSGKKIARHFGFTMPPVIVSHACISGLVAMITAQRMLQAGQYENMVIAGADIITRFILSGFQSFQAVSSAPCKPFDANRTGINLGEAAASVVLSIHKPDSENCIVLKGGAISNDANHISGPSRTGQELFFAMKNAMHEAKITKEEVDFISLHGTATLYNDDMESKAVKLAELQHVPVNSLKGYYGHTLGAAGLLETVISIASLNKDILIPTMGYQTPGTAEAINVCRTLQHAKLTTFLKTASGFGGCNAAIVIVKL